MVVLGHWLLTGITYQGGHLSGLDALDCVSWGGWVTLLLQVMPVFFLVGATLTPSPGQRTSSGAKAGPNGSAAGRCGCGGRRPSTWPSSCPPSPWPGPPARILPNWPSSTLLGRSEGGGEPVECDGLPAQGAGAEDEGQDDLQFSQGLVEGHPGAATYLYRLGTASGSS